MIFFRIALLVLLYSNLNADSSQAKKFDEIGWYITYEKNPEGRKLSKVKTRTVYCWNGQEIGDDKIGVDRLLKKIAKSEREILNMYMLGFHHPLGIKSDKLPSIFSSRFADIVRVCRKHKIKVIITERKNNQR